MTKKRIIPNLQGVDIGYALVDKSVISLISEENCNFEEEVYPQFSCTKQVVCHND